MTQGWPSPPAQFELAPGAVHVWRLDLDTVTGLDAAFALLSDDERARAAGARVEREGRRFVAGRAALRHLLSGYVRADPRTLAFEYGPNGKPTLKSPTRAGLEFNLSHSHGLALFAFAIGRPVGIDVERLADASQWRAVAARFFSARERAALDALPPGEQAAGFYRAWTRKEAYVKARGDAFGLSVEKVEVTLTPGEPPRLLRSELEPEAAARWNLIDLDPGPGLAAALAVHGAEPMLECWEASPSLLT